jgi:pyruvate/2-oxoglutarate dehydrogenase complex dihydrolipoamide dehydrogenase (E3) component
MPRFEALEPHDEHNKKLEANVHPSDWVNPEPAGRYNLIVIGAGTAGLVTAAGAAGLGAKVALVERGLMGGDCLNVGCVPSKGVISAARVARTVRDAGKFGVESPEASVDFPRVMERMRRLRARISPADSARRFRDLGVDVFLGQGMFTGSDTLQVGDRTLRFKKAVIATGARASAPPIPGLDGVRYLTNESLFSLTELPRRLGVIGAGPIGCEMAQAFALLGSEVHLVEAAHGILPREDPEAARIVEQSMERDGVHLRCCGRDTRIEAGEDGTARLVLDSHDQHYDQAVDALLVSVGRAPNVEGLGLETVGVEFDVRDGVRVDDRLRTTHPRIYAAGDICSPYKFTHAADFMARIVIQNALFMGRARASALTIPWATYTSPEIAHVGLTAQQAQDRGIEIETYTQGLEEVDRAILEGEDEGFARIHVKKGSDRIVGATIVATNAGDMISEVSLAMTHGLGLKKIGSAIHPYPTQAEAVRKLGDQYNRSRLTPFVRSVLSRWLAWTR